MAPGRAPRRQQKKQRQRFFVSKVFAVASTSASTAGLKRHKRVRVAAPHKTKKKRVSTRRIKATGAAGIAKKKEEVAAAAAAAPHNSSSQIYVLELQDGYVYVGKTSRGVQARLREHMTGKGACPAAAFTKVHRPTGKLLPRLGNLEGEGDGPERDETLRQMYLRGPQMVRGWKYVRGGMLRRPDLEEIEANIRELFDLCRTCGKTGHFATQCKERKDRNGKALRASVAL